MGPGKYAAEFIQGGSALTQQGRVCDVGGQDALAIVPFYPGLQQVVKSLIQNDAAGLLHRRELDLGQDGPQAQARGTTTISHALA